MKTPTETIDILNNGSSMGDDLKERLIDYKTRLDEGRGLQMEMSNDGDGSFKFYSRYKDMCLEYDIEPMIQEDWLEVRQEHLEWEEDLKDIEDYLDEEGPKLKKDLFMFVNDTDEPPPLWIEEGGTSEFLEELNNWLCGMGLLTDHRQEWRG